MEAVVEVSDLVQVVENYVRANKVMVFSKTYCPYCIRVKELFQSLGENIFALELDKVDEGHLLQQAMARKTGRSSVPQVFVNEYHVGGCDDTIAAYESGKLKELLSRA